MDGHPPTQKMSPTSLPMLLLLSNMVLNFLSWTWRAKRSYCSGVNLYIFPWIQYHGSQSVILFQISVSSSLDWVLISHPSYGDLYESHYRAMLALVSPGLVQVFPIWPQLTQFHTVWPCLALFGPIRPFFGSVCTGIVPYVATLRAISEWIFTLDQIKFLYDLWYHLRSTKYGQGICSFATNMHKFVLVSVCSILSISHQYKFIADTIIFLEDCTYKQMKEGFIEFIHQVSCLFLLFNSY